MSAQRYTLLISGKVQGVYYRASAVETALRLELTGFARNLTDGRVEVVAEGPRNALIQFERWCKEGPPAAKVLSVDCEKEPATNEFSGFTVLRP